MDLITYSLLKKYIQKILAGGGVIKGKNCTVQSIEPIEGGNRVTFKWTLDDGTVETDTMDVMNGEPAFCGTQAEWDALTLEEKLKYTCANITDDYDEDDFAKKSVYDPNGTVEEVGGIEAYVGQIATSLNDKVQNIQNELDDYVLAETPNVYDPTKDLIDTQLTTKGATSQSTNVNTSDYIDITALNNPCVAATVRTGSQNLRFCFYDADKVNLGSATTKPISIASNDESLHAIEPPQEAVYIRFHYYAPSVSKIYVGEYDESYIYVPHELYLKSSKEVVTARKDYVTLNARLNAIEDNLPTNNKVVEYWGDSLTQGNQDLTGVKRSTVLSSLLGETWTVKNYGVGGEQANTIAARAGGVYVYVNNITIPADTTPINVNDALIDAFDETLDLGSGIYSSNYESWPTVNPCLIDGIECQLTKADLSSPVMLNRVTAGEAHAITRPTAIIMHSNTLAKGPILIICIGQNRGFNNSADELISLIDGIIEARKSTRYIVVGMIRALAEDTWQAEYNAKLKTKYGNHYLDIEKYLKSPIYDLDGTTIISSYGLQDNGLTPTEADLQSISNNRYPLSLLAPDELHLNQYGYTAWANREYLLGEWLGYWT